MQKLWTEYFFSFFLTFLLIRVACIKMLNVFQRVEPIHETQTGFSLFFNNYCDQPFSFFVNTLILKQRFHILKTEFKGIHTRYVQYKYTFFCKLIYKLLVSTRSFSDGLCLNGKRCLVQNKIMGHVNVTETACTSRSIESF